MIIGFAFGLYAQNQTLESILENYFSVNGKQEYLKTNSIIKEGYRIRNDIMPVKFYQMRPDKYMMIYDLADMTAYRAFDGEIAWYTAPWRGTVNPEVFTDEQLEAIIRTFAFDPSLYNWESHGNNIEYIGNENFKNAEHFVLELTDKNNQKTSFFINSETFLLAKIQSVTEREGNEIINETHYSEHKRIGGMVFPFLEESFSNGVRIVSIEFDEIVINPKIENSFFEIETHFEKE